MMYGQCRCQTLDREGLCSETGVPVHFLTDRTNAVVDDCVAATLGGCDRYLKTMLTHKGTLFVTPGYVEEHVRQQRGMNLVDVLGQYEQLKVLFEHAGYKSLLKLDNQIHGFEEYGELVDIFSRTFDLNIGTMPCNLAVFEDTYDWTKSEMMSRAPARQHLEAHGVV
jgi:hypothetical protein